MWHACHMYECLLDMYAGRRKSGRGVARDPSDKLVKTLVRYKTQELTVFSEMKLVSRLLFS